MQEGRGPDGMWGTASVAELLVGVAWEGRHRRRCSINLKLTFPAALVGASLVNSGNQGDSEKAGKRRRRILVGRPSSCFSNICAAQAGQEGSQEHLGVHGQVKVALQSLKALKC